MGFNGDYPLVMTNIAIENGHRNSEFFHKKMVIFHSYVSLPEGNPFTLLIPPKYCTGGCAWNLTS